MACEAIHSGERFLAASLAQLDCQAQTLGSYGYGALADPGSPASLALAGSLTIFVALFGARMLLGSRIEGRDLILDLLRVAIVLTLATSWPAWRTLGYDLVIGGPGEIFRSLGLASGLPGASGDLAGRLQRVDEGLAVLNTLGTGRLGVASGDWFQLGFARAAFLTGTLVPLALVRLAAGILLALAPLMAGLLLFGVSRGIFAGWARALVMVFLASIAVSLVQAVQLALVEPWLQDALARRAAQTETLDVAVEALALTLGFGLAALGLVAIMGRIAFSTLAASAPGVALSQYLGRTRSSTTPLQPNGDASGGSLSRARSTAIAVREAMSREARAGAAPRTIPGLLIGSADGRPGAALANAGSVNQLGSSYRRSMRRRSAASQRRDEPK